MRKLFRLLPAALLAMTLPAMADFATEWQLGEPGRAWPVDGVGSGIQVDFVQEAGVNPPPGDPNSPSVNQQADDDFYFAGSYPEPIGNVFTSEIAMERAFAGIDNDLRIHFNLPSSMSADSLARFSLEANNLDQRAENADPRYGVVVSFNGNTILDEVVIRPGDLGTIITSPEFTLSSVGALFGPGGDNIVALRGVNYNGEGGGNWMGMDYHHLEIDAVGGPGAIPTLSEWGLIIFSLLLLTVGVVHIRRQAPVMATAGASISSASNDKPLFIPQLFAKCLAATWTLAVTGLAVAISIMGTLPVRDIVGTMISATIVAFLAMICMTKDSE